MMDFYPGTNWIVATAPSGDSTKRAASTEFVTQAISSSASNPVTDFISGGVAIPANQDYRVIEYIPFAMTFANFYAKLSTGTLTAYLSINAATVTGSTLNLGTSQLSTVLSALNTAAIGSTLILTVSSVTSAANLSFTVKFTR